MAPLRMKIQNRAITTQFLGIFLVEGYDGKKTHKDGKYEDSPPFFIDVGTAKYAWRLRFYGGGCAENPEWISIEFVWQSENSITFEEFQRLTSPMFSLSLLNNKGVECEMTTSEDPGFEDGQFNEFVRRSQIKADKSLLVNGGLRIKFCIEIENPEQAPLISKATSTSTLDELSRTEKEAARDSVFERMGRISLSAEYCDVKLIVKEEEFHSIRAILATGSPLLASMMNPRKSSAEKDSSDDDSEAFHSARSEVNEKTTDVLAIKVDGAEPLGVENMIKFFHTGTIDKEAAKEVLVVAEKFAIADLKELCEDMLTSQLSTKNIYEIFQISYENNAEQLKQKSKAFIHDHYAEICRDPEFRELLDKISPTKRTSFFIAAPKPPLPSTSSP